MMIDYKYVTYNIYYSLSRILEFINDFRSSFNRSLTAEVVGGIALLSFTEFVQESLESRNGERLGISGVLHAQDSSVTSTNGSFIIPFTVLLVSNSQVFNSLENFI